MRRALVVLAAGVLALACASAAEDVPAAQRVACPADLQAPAAPLPAETRKGVVSLKKTSWEATFGGEEAARPHVRERLAGWPEHALVDPRTLPEGGRELALRIARDTWRGLAAFTDRENGLPIDNVRFAPRSVEPAEARVGDYTSGTNVGLHLVSIVGAEALGFVTHEEALAQVGRILDTVEGLETYRGFLFNFYDTTVLERTSNFVSFVDSAWLTAALIVVRQSYPEVAERATKLVDRTDYGFFYAPATRRISHGYYVTPGMRSPFDYGVFYTEARLGALLAIGKGDMPEAAWWAMVRVFPSRCPGQLQVPQGVREETVRGEPVLEGWYQWGDVRYVPSWGGSMFEALMPTLLLDERALAPDSLGANDVAHATVQRRYAIEELGYPVWGISPCAQVQGDGYGEYGVRPLGSHGYNAGAVTPHASALAVEFDPELALANLRRIAERYPMYGDFGFWDAVDPRSEQVAWRWLALDQSMLFIALANHLTDGAIRHRFAADPVVQRVVPMLQAERFFPE